MATGKYAKVIDALPKFPHTDLEQQERVNLIKAKLTADLPRQAATYAQLFAQLRNEKDALEDELSDLNTKIEAVSQLLVDQYEAEGTHAIKLETGHSVTVQNEPYAQVQDRDTFRTWCIEAGLERSLMLPWQTTNALTKERLLAGLPEPDGVAIYSKPKLVLRKT